MKTLFTAKATTVAGRNGHSETEDKSISLDLAMPGSGKKGANPEQLFAMGYSACFGGAIEVVAKKMMVEVDEVKVQADVALNQDDKGGYFIGVALNVTLAGVETDQAREIVEAAHQVCPYSKATRGNIEVTLKVNNEKLAKAA